MEEALASEDAFRAYLDDVTDVTIDIFRAVFKTGDIKLLTLLLTRDICISQAVFEVLPEGALKDMVRAYRRDWSVYYIAKNDMDVNIEDYENINLSRVINGQTLNQVIKEAQNKQVSSEDDDTGVFTEEEEDDFMFWDGESFNFVPPPSPQARQDEVKMQDNGRLRIYQRRRGSLYCGLYAIQHVLNSVDIVKQDDLDMLSHHVIDDIQLSAEAKMQITQQDHIDPNGNYSIETLCKGLENVGYVTLSNHRARPTMELLQDANVFGIIANVARSHWFAFRRVVVEDDEVEDVSTKDEEPVSGQWEECDSLALGAFPIRTSQQVATRTFEAYIAVIRPTPLPDMINWVDQPQRLAQLFEMVKRNQ